MTAISITREAVVPVDSVKPYPSNPRVGDLPSITASLQAHGQYRAIVVNERTGEVLAGNHTWQAAVALGWETIAASFVDVDEEESARIVLVDNRTPDLAEYDNVVLADVLSSLPDLEGTGYSLTDLDELLAGAGQTPGKDTEPKPRPAAPRSVEGDLYLLGEHRVLCGDSTNPLHVERLLGGKRADLLYTDPPYGMSYSSVNHKVIKGDDLRGDDLEDLVRDALTLGKAMLRPGAAAYVWCTWRTYPEFVVAVKAAGLKPSGCIVWKKGRVGPGSSHYRPEHEFCLYCKPEEENDHGLCVYCAGDEWEGGRGQIDVWEVSRDQGYEHPTQKPVVLAERALEHTTRGGGRVLDLFGGSGSTLLACENLNRRGHLMELDPAYVDVICDRWARHTGLEPIRED